MVPFWRKRKVLKHDLKKAEEDAQRAAEERAVSEDRYRDAQSRASVLLKMHGENNISPRIRSFVRRAREE